MPAVLLEHPAQHVALVRINRPEARNALNAEVRQGINSVFPKLDADPEVRCIVLTGNETVFAAGADLKERATMDVVDAVKFVPTQGIMNCRKPVIAAVNGYALGGGCEIAMACHLRIASDTASFGQPEINLGIIPGYGGTQRLPRLVGKGVALEMMLTGKRIDAREAYRIGLVNYVVPPEDLLKTSKELAKKITEKSTAAIKYILDAVTRGVEMPLDYALFLEADLAALCFNTEDANEGIKAFIEKRKPNFKGK